MASSGKSWLVARREFVENARTKGFWISMLIGPVLIIGAIALMTVLQKSKDVRRYAVLDHSGWLAEAIAGDADQCDLGAILERWPEPGAEGAPAFLAGGIWARVRALPEDQRQALAEHLLRPELEGIGAELPEDALPAPLREDIEKQAGPGFDLEDAWKQLYAFRTWWQELSPAQRLPLSTAEGDPRFAEVPPPEGGWTEELCKAGLKDGSLFAYFVLEDVPLEAAKVGRYVSNNFNDRDLPNWYADKATRILRERRIAKLGLDDADARLILQRAGFADNKLTEKGDEKAVGVSDRVAQGAPLVFVVLLWMSILMISQMLLTNTIEEKSNRIIEVLLSSVSPLQLLSGKIVGLALTGFSILAFYALFAWGVVLVLPLVFPGAAEAIVKLQLEAVLANPRYLGSFFLYFLTGYVFFASLLCGIGSVSNSLKDAQNIAQPVMLLLMVPYIASFVLVNDPNGTAARVLSYIPPFTPFIMMVRAGGPPPMIDYVLTSVLLLVSTVLCFYGAAKVFRVGILMTGKPPRLREILRMMRAPVGVVPRRD